jgi:hypothetical protein
MNRLQNGGRATNRRPSLPLGLLALTALTVAVLVRNRSLASGSTAPQSRRLAVNSQQKPTIQVYAALPLGEENAPVARKQEHDWRTSSDADAWTVQAVHYLSQEQQADFVQRHCPGHAGTFSTLNPTQPHLASEVYKFCALSLPDQTTDAVAFVDSESPFLIRWLSAQWEGKNVAVLSDSNLFPEAIHGSFLLLRNTEASRKTASRMLQILTDTPVDILTTRSMWLPHALYQLVTVAKDDWDLWSTVCRMDPLRRHDNAQRSSARHSRLTHHCPDLSGYCCSIQSNSSVKTTVMMSRHPVLPYQTLPDNVPTPYNPAKGHFHADELPFISTVSEQVHEAPVDAAEHLTPNFFDMLLKNDCLPANEACSKCLREKKGANCKTCAGKCSCYCRTLCHESPPPKHVAATWTVAPPLYARDPHRLVPRIVHQTWFEELTPDKYPNMSRLVESFRRSGWEYKFYSDDEADRFLSTHFPPQVREAYNSLIPGAFKADLFRYCVLLIYGGVYADVDIQLESALDLSIAPDVGFMVPIDEVSTRKNASDSSCCLISDTELTGCSFFSSTRSLANLLTNKCVCGMVSSPPLQVIHFW